MISLNEFVALCGEGKRQGNGYMCRCPAHDDGRSSLSVKEGNKGLLIKCFAGCETAAVLDALGLKWSDIMRDPLPERDGRKGRQRQANPPPSSAAGSRDQTTTVDPETGEIIVHRAVPTRPEPPAKQAKKPADLSRLKVGGTYSGRSGADQKITRCYDYEDEDGQCVLKVFRTDKKEFPVIHRDGDSWYWGDGGHKELLYRLPQALAAIRKGETVYIVEGEKDADTLADLGYTAVTNKGGAGKWTEESTALNRQMSGAIVAIVPDVDAPGRRSGAAIARALEKTAKEVRLVNLRRLDCELPEKGDVSDAAEQLGGAFREAFDKLVAQSPVLSRQVSDDDYEEYFVGIRGCRTENGRIMGYKSESWYPLSSFVALPVEQIELDDGLTEPTYLLHILGWSSKGRRLRPLDVPLSQFVEMSWLTKWGLDAVIDEGNGAKQKLRRIIQEAGSRVAVMRRLYAHTGWRMIDGRLCFLHGGGAIGSDNARIQLDYGFTRYRLDGWTDAEMAEADRAGGRRMAMDASWRTMRCASLRIGAPLTGLMYLSPLKYFLEKRGHRPSMIPFVSGRSGSGKTVITSLVLNHFGTDFGFESSAPATFDDTPGGLSLKMFELKDMPLLVDDYHPVDDPRKAAQMAQTAETMGRMIGDGMRRSRMKSDTSAQEDKPARCLCIATGEQPPNSNLSSSMARLYVIHVDRGDVPIPGKCRDQSRVDEINNLHALARAGALSESMRGYIEWLTGMADELPGLLEELLKQLQDEAYRRCAGQEMHARMPQAVAYLMLGLEMMLRYMSQDGGILQDADLDDIRAELWEAVLSNTMEQARDMREEAPVDVFCRTLRELQKSGQVTFVDVRNLSAALPRGMIGYVDDNFYYLYFGQAYGAVQESLMKQQSRMPIGKGTLLKMMAGDDMIAPDAKGGNTRVYNKGGLKFRAVWMPRWVLDGKSDAEPVVVQEKLPF